MQGFNEIEHKADIGLEIFGETLDQLFIQAIHGFYTILVPDIPLAHLKPSLKNVSLALKEDSAEHALVALLNELNFRFTVKQKILLPVKFLQCSPGQPFVVNLTAGTLSPVPQEWLENSTEIKAVTYHNLHIEQNETGFSTRIIFDV